MKAILFVFLISPLIFLFQNCGPTLKNHQNAGSLSEVELSKYCGQEGFERLHKEYFRPQCGGCHGENGFVEPRFASNNLLTSYYEAKSIPLERVQETVTQNSFCGDSCSVDKESDTYKRIEYWVLHPESCN